MLFSSDVFVDLFSLVNWPAPWLVYRLSSHLLFALLDCWLVSMVGLQHRYWTTAWLIGWTVWETFQQSSSCSCFPDCNTKLPFEKRPSLISVFRCIIVLLGTQSKCFVASLNNSSDGEREIICPSRTLMQFSVLFQDELFSWRRNCWRYSPKEIEWTSRELAFPGQPNGHFVQTSFN